MPTTDNEGFVEETSFVFVRRKADEKNSEHALRHLPDKCVLSDVLGRNTKADPVCTRPAFAVFQNACSDQAAFSL
jgi:hypothetical protein